MGKEKIVAGFIGAGRCRMSMSFCVKLTGSITIMMTLASCSGPSMFSGKSAQCLHNGLDSQTLRLTDFVKNGDIDTVFILGPNKVHYEHFRAVLGMKRHKTGNTPETVCSTPGEEASIRELVGSDPSVNYQVGFQYLFISAVREALLL